MTQQHGEIGPLRAGHADEVLQKTRTDRLVRRFTATGSIILKQMLGPDPEIRVRHEKAMMERVSAIPGVEKLNAATTSADSIALEDVHGVPLTLAVRSQPFDTAALLEFALQVTDIIAAIHRAGVVHRDINPSSILLVGPQRRPVLVDFHMASSSVALYEAKNQGRNRVVRAVNVSAAQPMSRAG